MSNNIVYILTLENENMSAERIKKFGEVFTPPELVNKILDKLPADIWKDPNKKWLDPTCGDGAFLIEVKRRLLEYHKESHILANMIYGVDIQEDNIYNCIVKLYRVENKARLVIINTPQAIISTAKQWEFKGRKGIKALFLLDGRLIFNIICANGLTYQYNFGEEDDTIDGKGQYELNF